LSRRALLVLILGLAAFLRLYQIGSVPPGLFRDEAIDGCNALEGPPRVFYPEDNGREGLYINEASVFVRAFGNKVWPLRLPAALFGIATVAGVYLLGCELDSAGAGLWAAFFLATSTWHLMFSRIAFRAIGSPLFLVWSLWMLLVALRRRSVGLAIAAGCVYGLGFYTYLAYRATPLLLALVLWRKPARLVAAFAGAAAVVAAPLAAYFVRHPADFTEHSARLSVFAREHPAAEIARNTWRTARMIFTRGDVNWRHNIPWRAEVFWPVAILFAIGLVIVARRRSWILPVWLAVGALPAVLSNEGVPHALRSLLMVPAVCLLAARAASSVRVPAIAVGVAAVLLACEPYHMYFQVWARDPHVAEAFDVGISGPPDSVEAAPGRYLAGTCGGIH